MWNTLYYYVLAGCLVVADAKLLLLKVVWLLSAISVSRLDPFELHVG